MSGEQDEHFRQPGYPLSTPSSSTPLGPMDEWKMPHEMAVSRSPPPIQVREGVTPSEIEYLSQRSKEISPNTTAPEPVPAETRYLYGGSGKGIHDIPEVEPKSPTLFETGNLFQRDTKAIAYARSRLLEGDTFVVVKYPTSYPICDSTGFLLDTTFRVHSHKLLATGSRVFAKMLSEENQHKYRQRPLFKNMTIPDDVRYVLDLTPATDDDDALELVTSLSCPKGILHWSASRSRLGIPQRFVCGEDEKILGQLEPTTPSTPPIVHNPKSALSAVDLFGLQIKEATERSIKDNGSNTPVEPDIAITTSTSTSTKPLPADYCGIRHCAGIERMLQLIEGKEARLDSAPKVWTVAMLAGFFDCTSAVVDAVCTWVVSQSNGIIIEILPESCLRLGLVLRSELITRAAFAVLVSEEALCIGGQENNVPFKREATTPYGRLREDLDDDTLNMVQHAGRSFFDLIDAKVKDLLDEKLPWFENLPEYAKLQNFKFKLQKETATNEESLKSITSLQENLAHYVRGRLFYCLLRQLRPEQITRMQLHRLSETYVPCTPNHVGDAYDAYASPQRVLTRQFWEMVRSVGWTATPGCTNLLYQNLEYDNPHFALQTNLNVANHFHIKHTLMSVIFAATDEFNISLFEHVTRLFPIPKIKPNFTLANISDSTTWIHPSLAERKERVIQFASKYERDLKFGNTENSMDAYYLAWTYSRINMGFSVPDNSEFFELYKFMDQVREYINFTCDAMLDRGENPSFTLPETLGCLTDAEYKFLPLFAGGFEDGSGGVYQDELPPAEAGPSGPGPSYHTGFSIASAAGSASSEGTVDWESVGRGASTESTIDGWSRDVDDGYTDHLDRRRVGSEVSFGSRAFSELGVMSEDSFEQMDVDEYKYMDKGKGKEIETGTEEYVSKGKGKEIESSEVSTVRKPFSAIDDLMNDDFFVEGDDGDEGGFDSGGEDDFDFMDDSGDDTATEKGDHDDEDVSM